MKTFSIILISLLCGLASATNFGRLMCLGDSLTAGGSTPPAYRQELDTLLTSNSQTYTFIGPNNWGAFYGTSIYHNVHCGFGGWSAYDLKNGRSDATSSGKLSNWLNDYYPDTVILMCGTNDIWRFYSGSGTWDSTSQSSLEAGMPGSYDALLSEIFAKNSSTKVLFMAPPKTLLGGTSSFRYNYAHALLPIVKNRYNYWAAQGYDIHFADLWTPVSATQGVDIGSDDIHWNSNGAQTAANALYPALTETNHVLSGKLLDSSFAGDWSVPVFTFVLQGTSTNNSHIYRTGTLTVNSSGEFTLPTVLSGNYDLSVFGSHWLNKLTAYTYSSSQVGITLINGDIDHDNAISVFDYSVFSDYFDKSSADSDWNTVGANGFRPRDADLDGDDANTVFDYGIIEDNFDLSGD